MLREIAEVRQDQPGMRRRWFQDDYFDLFVWTDTEDRMTAFQLSYDKPGQERLLRWDVRHGYAHQQVDSGEDSPLKNRTPILVEDAGRFPKYRVISQFDARSVAVEAALRWAIRARLATYVPAARAGRRHGLARR